MPLTVSGLGIGLNRIEGRRSWVFVRGEGLQRNQDVTISGSDGTNTYSWQGRLNNGNINSSETLARVHVECTQGLDSAKFADIENDDLVGPGDLVDVDITVTDGTTTGEGNEGGVILFP